MKQKRQNEYVKGYVLKKIVVIDNMSKKYTKPKLSIPKDSNGKPSIAKGKYWYVYYHYRNPITNKFDWSNPIKTKNGINRLKTVKERKAFGKKIIEVLTNLLEDGFCPYINPEYVEKESDLFYTVVEAIDYALEKKRNEVKARTIEDYEDRSNQFKKWLTVNNLNFLPIQDINKPIVSQFLNHISSQTSNRNTNNTKAAISALFTKLVKDGILKENVFKSIEKLKTVPKKNAPFSESEIKRLKAHLEKNDPYLYKYMVFVAYTFLRTVEVSSLQIKHINLANSQIKIETKGEGLSTVVIIDKLKPILHSFNIKDYDKEDYLFTPMGVPGPYQTKKPGYKSNYMSKRFAKVRKSLDLDIEHTIYSIRHTFATDILNGFIAEGFNEREAILKMLPITRHKSEKSLRNYLRSVDTFITKDYSDKITTDF